MAESSLTSKFALNELFGTLDEGTLAALEHELELVKLTSDSILFQQGDPGDCLYVLIKGHLIVRMQTADGRELVVGEESEPGTSVGEMALISGQERLLTVAAQTDVELIKLSKEGFRLISEKKSLLVADLAKMTAFRWRQTQLAVALANLIGELDSTVLRTLQADLEWSQLAHGEILFEQGDPGDAMYIVVNGRLRIIATGPDRSEKILDEIGSGEIVGEFALITGEPRTATVYAIRETSLVKMTEPVFARLVERHPQAMIKITRKIISRHPSSLRVSSMEALSSFNIALLPISPDVALQEFSQKLAGSLGEFGRVMHLSGDRLDQVYGHEGVAQLSLDNPMAPVLDSWMSEQESKFDFIIFAADPTWSTWSRRCLSQADRLLLIGHSGNDPEPGSLEEAARTLASEVTTELVLLHPDIEARPIGTAKWLERRQLQAHHHICIHEDSHYNRLARWLTGRTVGLVLSGGGARGFAHLGVFRALEELGIQIDYVGGTSMGSLIGAGFAMGRDSNEMNKLADAFANPKQLFDYTLPLASLMASKKVTKLLRGLFGNLFIEDLWLPFFCISSNMTRAEPVVHQSGLLWKSVRASIAIPGIFTPILHEGDLLADGGPMNNFPVDVMHQFCGGGPVIGVNVSPSEELAYSYQDKAGISGWKILWSRLNPFREPIDTPSLIANIMRAIEINSVHQINSSQHLADVLIQPDVGQFGTLAFSSYKPISEAGYFAAREELISWLEEQRLAAT